jgi:hypothetical protein
MNLWEMDHAWFDNEIVTTPAGKDLIFLRKVRDALEVELTRDLFIKENKTALAFLNEIVHNTERKSNSMKALCEIARRYVKETDPETFAEVAIKVFRLLCERIAELESEKIKQPINY